MSPFNAARKELYTDVIVLDPGASGTIVCDRSPGICNLVSTGAEARTLGRPTRAGAFISLHHQTDGGDITLTVTGGYDEDGSTSFTFSDEGQFAMFQSFQLKSGGAFFWRKVADHNTGNISQSVLDILNAATVTATELNSLAVANATLTTGAGVGITTGTGTIYKTSVLKIGQIYHTCIYIDLTGLASIATDGDVIGVNGGGAAHIGRITAAQNGTIESMRVTCEEAPAGGLADIDFFRATVATAVQDDAISGVTGQATTGVTNAGNWTNGLVKCATAVPAANDYLYLCSGAASGAGTYTAGKFRIELIGY